MIKAGTPKSILDAALNARTELNKGLPEERITTMDVVSFLNHIHDFINQRVGEMMLSHDPSEVAAANKLYRLLVDEKKESA